MLVFRWGVLIIDSFRCHKIDCHKRQVNGSIKVFENSWGSFDESDKDPMVMPECCPPGYTGSDLKLQTNKRK